MLTSVENKVGSTTVSKYEYPVNRLNQRTARTQSGTAFSATTTDAFTYNSKGELVLSENDTLTAREFGYSYDGIGNRISSVVAGGTPTLYEVNTVNQYVEMVQSPNPAEEPTYDSDGNQLTDGKGHTLVWDGENRLVEFFPTTPGSGAKRIVNTYDGQSRRVKKTIYTWSGSDWVEDSNQVFVYDGWLPIGIYTFQNSQFSILTSLTWGRDLSTSLQGAGGVGGLLATHDGTTQGVLFYDANGNIGQVMDGSAIIAHYEYDPFGNTINATGTYADDNPFRFSTKFQDEENDLYYYGYRFYNPETGRWLNRDPIEEEGGLNLYAFVSNTPLNTFDLLGNEGFSIRDATKSLKSYFSQILDWTFWGTRGCYNVMVPLPIPGAVGVVSLCGSVQIQGGCRDGKRKICVIGDLTVEGGLYAAGTKAPIEGFSPPPENWLRPISIRQIMTRPKSLGRWLRVPFSHGFQFGELPQDGLTGNITASATVGIQSWSFGVRGYINFPGATPRVYVGMGVGQGTGLSFGGGVTFTHCADAVE